MENRGGRSDAAGNGGGPRQFYDGGDPGAGPSGFAGRGTLQQGSYQDFGGPRNGSGRGYQGNFNNNFSNQANFNNQGNYNNQGNFNTNHQGNFNNFNGCQGGGQQGGFGDFHPGNSGDQFYGGGNGNPGYRNRRRYEFRGNRPVGGANAPRGVDRNRHIFSQNSDGVDQTVGQQTAGSSANVPQQQPSTAVVQRSQQNNVTYLPKKAPAIQRPLVKNNTMQPKAVQQQSAAGGATDVVSGGNSGASRIAKKRDKDPDKVKCFRCDVVGHFSIDCTAEICDFCESPDHANKDCHLHSAPKPLLSVYGYGQEELLFMEVQPTPSFRPRSDNGRMGRITVTGGALPMEKIVERLRWVVDDTFQWDVQPQGNNVYKTQFPNKNELARATCIGLFQVKGTTCSMEITEWKSATKPTKRLEEAWVLISGVPDDMMRNYLILWGLGGLIGKTKEVDMAYSRRHGVVRSLVKVVDIAHIPYQKEIWHEDECYVLTIELEEYDMAIDGDDPKDGPEDGNGNEGAGKEDNGSQSNHNLDRSKSNKVVDKKNETTKSAKGGVIINAPGARTVPMDMDIPFGSFSSRNTLPVGNDLSMEGAPPSTCRRLFQSLPSSPKVSLSLSVGRGSNSSSTSKKSDVTANLNGVFEKLKVVSPATQAFSAPLPVSPAGVIGAAAQYSAETEISGVRSVATEFSRDSSATVQTDVLGDVLEKEEDLDDECITNVERVRMCVPYLAESVFDTWTPMISSFLDFENFKTLHF
jgi:hypothetical protein